MGREQSQLVFDAARHTFRVGERRMPSVTQVLKLAGLIDSRWYTPESAIKGQYVAQATQMYDEGTLDESTLDPALKPYIEAWKRFLSESGAEIVLIEHRAWHPCYGYAGILDRWAIVNGRDTIIDIKSGQPQPWHQLQTAGYARCFETPFQRMAVCLRNDGKYKAVTHEDQSDASVFLSAVAVANWKLKNGGSYE